MKLRYVAYVGPDHLLTYFFGEIIKSLSGLKMRQMNPDLFLTRFNIN